MRFIIIGGGAAGVFGALTAAAAHPEAEVIVLEKSPKLLAKVRISGGGRCNVTHHCFDPTTLAQNYPRGHRELLGPFSRFQPKDIILWFKEHGVQLKVEADGRMFPTTDNSQTIIDCFLKTANQLGVKILTHVGVEKVERQENSQFKVFASTGEPIVCDRILLATGGGQSNSGFKIAETFGHTIIPPVPSLFTFNIEDKRLADLQGISFPEAELEVLGTSLKTKGPLLITHWGLSGPTILKLSAWGARVLYDLNYQFTIGINFLPTFSSQAFLLKLKKTKEIFSLKQIIKNPLFDLPKRFWERVIYLSGIPEEQTWAHADLSFMEYLTKECIQGKYTVAGKSTNKDEFVTCGGVTLKEVNFKTMESKLYPGLFFAGEVLDIDGITGGFNFQAAWTTAWIAGNSMG